MICIMLSRNFVAIIDAEDLPRVEQYIWHVHMSGGTDKKPGQPYARTTIDGKKVYLHRFITGADLPWQVDHRNHQTLDCRRSNLEITSHRENQSRRRNAKAYKAGVQPPDGEGVVCGNENADAQGDKSAASIREHGADKVHDTAGEYMRFN